MDVANLSTVRAIVSQVQEKWTHRVNVHRMKSEAAKVKIFENFATLPRKFCSGARWVLKLNDKDGSYLASLTTWLLGKLQLKL